MNEKASPNPDSTLDPIAEAMARAQLRHRRAKPVAPAPRPVGQAARKLVRKHDTGGGSPLSVLQMDWTRIIGADLAKLCYPVKLAGAKSGRTLTLRVIPAAATVIQHQEEVIRQRLSVAAGGNITRLKYEQGALPHQAAPQIRRAMHLSAEQEAALARAVAAIESPSLKAAIVGLGRAVLADGDRKQ